jgi:hypothetical protein
MKKRALSSTRMASLMIPLTIILGFIVYIHIPINYRIYIVPSTNKPVCHSAGPPGSYRKISSIFNLMIFGLFPPLCMLISGIFTLHNIHRRQGFDIILSAKSKSDRRTKISERQILRMLSVQVLVYSLSGMLFSIAFIFISMNSNRQKSVVEIAQEKLVIAIVGMISNTGPALSFYLFTLSSQLFRKQLKRLFYRILRNEIQSNVDHTPTISIEFNVKQQLEQS